MPLFQLLLIGNIYCQILPRPLHRCLPGGIFRGQALLKALNCQYCAPDSQIRTVIRQRFVPFLILRCEEGHPCLIEFPVALPELVSHQLLGRRSSNLLFTVVLRSNIFGKGRCILSKPVAYVIEIQWVWFALSLPAPPKTQKPPW